LNEKVLTIEQLYAGNLNNLPLMLTATCSSGGTTARRSIGAVSGANPRGERVDLLTTTDPFIPPQFLVNSAMLKH
jgi:hypothetical protein